MWSHPWVRRLVAAVGVISLLTGWSGTTVLGWFHLGRKSIDGNGIRLVLVLVGLGLVVVAEWAWITEHVFPKRVRRKEGQQAARGQPSPSPTYNELMVEEGMRIAAAKGVGIQPSAGERLAAKEAADRIEAKKRAERQASQERPPDEIARALAPPGPRSNPPNPVVDAIEKIAHDRLNRAVDLLMESEDFRPKLLIAIRNSKRSGFGMLPEDITTQVLTWNKKVVALADECFSVEDATEVKMWPTIMASFAAMSGSGLAELVDNNRAALQRIINLSPPPKRPAA